LESAAYSVICEHLQKPHNAGSRPEARFFNTLPKEARDPHRDNLYASQVGHELGLQLKQTPHAFADGMGGRQKFFAGGLDLWSKSIDRPPENPYL
jgi:hypothetical protein